MVSCSFKGTGVDHKGKEGEQLDCKHRTRKKAGYVLRHYQLASFMFQIDNLFPAREILLSAKLLKWKVVRYQYYCLLFTWNYQHTHAF